MYLAAHIIIWILIILIVLCSLPKSINIFKWYDERLNTNYNYNSDFIHPSMLGDKNIDLKNFSSELYNPAII